MNARLQQRIQRYGWDKAAEFYEDHWCEQLAPAQTKMLEVANLQPADRVLDVACGTGLVSFKAAEAVGAGGEVMGVDLSESMVQHASHLARYRKLVQCKFLRSDAESFAELKDESFDAVLCALGLMYFPDTKKCLDEMWRVTRPGGRMAAAVWGERKACGWAEIFPIVDSRVSSEVCPMFFRMGAGDIFKQECLETGWVNPRAERMSTILHYSSEEDALAAVFAGGPVALAYSRFDDATKEEAHAEYIESIEKFRVGNGFEVPGEFVVLRADKSN